MAKNDKKPAARLDSSKTSESSQDISRRDVLRGVTAGGVLLSVKGWSRPVIESVSIPAHAQSSVGLAGGDSVSVTLPESASS